LITGNVSTDESRNEMRKSPGAPSPLANATTFCFHPFKFAVNGFLQAVVWSLVEAGLQPGPLCNLSQKDRKPQSNV
jgi:hypothetical protein